MIILGKYAGFCGGVSNSVNQTIESLKKYKELYCLGELVHNSQVIKSLEEKGLKIINDLDEVKDNSNVIIRAHGVTKEIYEKAHKKNINLIDLTCPKVLKIHNNVENYKNNNYFILLVGNKNHPEVLGTISFCGEKSIVLEDISELKKVFHLIEQNNYQHIVVFAQTTYKESLFNEITTKLKERYPNRNILIENTICNATHLRQEECREISKDCDCMIIIGGKNSSNTRKLYEISCEYCSNTYLIETFKELNTTSIKNYNKIGIMAGASTPKESIQEVIDKIS